MFTYLLAREMDLLLMLVKQVIFVGDSLNITGNGSFFN